jgi:iron complex outermembrane receptor protein
MKATVLSAGIVSLLMLNGWAAVTNDAVQSQRIETIVVQAERMQPLSASMGPEELQDDPLTLNAAAVAQRVPGVAGTYSSIDAVEVTMRGLGWERVPAQVDFLPIYGSCPARMDPPATYLAPESIEQMTLVKGLPSVTYGAGGTGGRVMLRTVPGRAAALDGMQGHASVTWNDAREGGTGSVGGRIGNGTLEAGASVAAVDYGDYTSGDGRAVPADNRSHSASATVRVTPDPDTAYFGSWRSHVIDHVDYPALPMDATEVTADILTFGGRHG